MSFTYTNSTYVIVIINLSLIIWVPWLWRYRIIPYLAKIDLNKRIKNHPDWKKLKTTENFLIQLYRKTNSDRISRKERKRLDLEDNEFIYGEIEFLSFFTILSKIKPRSGKVFYDLGCGSGKAVFTAAMFFDLSKACGIELLPGLCTVSNNLIKKAQKLVSLNNTELKTSLLRKISRIQFINDNFLNHNIADADIVFINATCLSSSTWELIIEKLGNLKSGSHIIVTTKKILHAEFDILYQSKELMSWGMNSVNIYKKK